MNLETRARDAVESLRVATPVDAQNGLSELHRSHQQRTTGKVIAALVAIAVGFGVVQFQRNQDRALPPASPSGDWVLITGGGSGDWSKPLAKQGVQTYPDFTAVDPATHRFLVGNSEGTAWNVMTPGQREPLLTIPCSSGACLGAAFGPGPDEVTMQTMPFARRPNSPDFRIEVIGPDGRSRGELGESRLGKLAWSSDGSTWAEVVSKQRIDQASFAVALRRPNSPETTALYQYSEQPPSWFDPEEHRFGDSPNAINGWGGPGVIDLHWAPDSVRLAFITVTTPETGGVDGDRNVQWQLLVANAATGEVERIADLGRCTDPVDDDGQFGRACDGRAPSMTWGPDGETLTALADSALTTYDLSGKVLESDPTSIVGPVVWVRAD